ncbi:E3 ubiquitin-protein ligase RNF130 [Galemys pyrenaicus]|uniref:E3 ubiquitin-protein ligase RNF130 n=1 Tax=Galemys pyrenaicus TaxID=202257 RepID=A0A8J6APM5_GALPY|nr:E3 ubiquitin-protein ligase RNF130 [Galemys pyrenaicus]
MSGAARAGPARLAALALLTCSLWPAQADNASQEYYTALINVTVQDPGRGAPLTFRIDRGRYGLDSPKAEVRGQVLAPLPIHGGEWRLGRSRRRDPARQSRSGGGGRGAPTPADRPTVEVFRGVQPGLLTAGSQASEAFGGFSRLLKTDLERSFSFR